jgi:FkbM family methyltransferase
MTDRSGVPVLNKEVLAKFRRWSGTVPSGYFAYFLGNLTRADYWAFPENIRALYMQDRYQAPSGPGNDDNILDWVILLEAVVEARGEFTMAALGAGWGRWLVAGALAARQRDLRPRLIGVEAEPTHYQWMREHFRDNQIDPDDHDLIEAAASGDSGGAWFYFGKPNAWYGQSIVHDARPPDPDSLEIEHNGERARRVRTVDVRDVTAAYRLIDYMHLDTQGAELDFLSSHPAILDEKVKRVLIGTHSNAIEEGLRALFTGLGWHCQYDIPLNGCVRVDDVEVTLGDGVQVWINPALTRKDA